MVQMKHNVSATASNTFWDLAFNFIPQVLEKRKRKVPKFIQQRRKLVKNNCPPVFLEYYYKKKSTGEVVKFCGSVAPMKAYQNPSYEKLFEIAYVKVCR